ncbi:MAG: 23S rRNA (adenine(2503)-C(2))-methyltransferase RlmN [Deinococcus sp.]|nr:23S rRNA (adenine(2503)-C(2))-methyltransferase RlmN [Deinococcus sp.]
MTQLIALKGLLPQEVALAGYRRSQLLGWVYRGVRQFQDMTDLPKSVRQELSQRYRLNEVVQWAGSESADGSVKYLFTLSDGASTEAVYMPYRGRITVCLSTMTGCPVKCVFCASGLLSGRPLTAAEMMDQHLSCALASGVSPQAVRNVVLMGIGEPLLNYDAAVRALRLFTHPETLHLSHRRITLSTVGISPAIRRLARENLSVTLALSLHAPNQELRQALIPLARRYPLDDLMDAVKEYQAETGRRVSFEYTLIRGKNDSLELARELGALLQGLMAHVNLIPLNPVPAIALSPTSRRGVSAFAEALRRCNVNVSIRFSRGQEIGAACGQLANALTLPATSEYTATARRGAVSSGGRAPDF